MSVILSSMPVFAAEVRAARSVDLAAYTLRAGVVRDAVVAAARGGARVRVRLERDPLDDTAGTLHAANAETVVLLRAAGADAALTPPSRAVLHMKAALVDGVAWLDDRNWAGNGPETILRDDDPGDVRALGDALADIAAPDREDLVGRAAASAAAERPRDAIDADLKTTKAEAQALEVALLRAAGPAAVDVESESFGSGGVYGALLARGRAGLPGRLLVAGREALQAGPAGDRERRRLERLLALGIDVRTGASAGADIDEKLAVTETAAWAGSANATYARGDAGRQRDWGLVTRVPALVDALRAAFERNWIAARPLAAPTAVGAIVPVSKDCFVEGRGCQGDALPEAWQARWSKTRCPGV